MCKNTIDEKIHDIVAQKGRMSDLLIDGKLTKQNRHQLVSYLLS
jgi:SNF2 family DNA or RNA helicase